MQVIFVDEAVFRATIAFASGRLASRSAIDWGLMLKDTDAASRRAVLHLLEFSEQRSMGEPWKSAWQLIEESWNTQIPEKDDGTAAYRMQQRVREGDRSGSLVASIVDSVAPRLKVEPFSKLHLKFNTPPKRPRRVTDLFSIGITSGRSLDPTVIEIGKITEVHFLESLASALDAAVEHGLHIAQRLGLQERNYRLLLGTLKRVYYVPATDLSDGENEPDQFATGIAPAVKLLHSVVARLLELDSPAAQTIIQGWRAKRDPIHLRLYAAMALDSRITTADEVAAFLLAQTDEIFWNLHSYPEVSELRAKRFTEVTSDSQAALIARLRKLPPKTQWPRGTPTKIVNRARLYWALRELRRLEVAGAKLSELDQKLLEDRGKDFPELSHMDKPTAGFLMGPTVRWVTHSPDETYATLSKLDRLQALEAAMISSRDGWDDDPAERAAAWMRDGVNAGLVLGDFETALDGAAAFPRVWNQFGWIHAPSFVDENEQDSDAARGLITIARLPNETLRKAIDGLAHWMLSWSGQLRSMPGAYRLFRRMWTIATEIANERNAEDESALSFPALSETDQQKFDMDALNMAAGKLVAVFLKWCPTLSADQNPFDGTLLGDLREQMLATAGKAGLIARARFIESIGYFLRADCEWAKRQLLKPLEEATGEALALWRSLARRTIFHDVLKIIGDSVADRATDLRLDRETRQMLSFSLVVDSLHSYVQSQAPAVTAARTQQVLRNVEDEIRAYAADALRRFVVDNKSGAQHVAQSSELLFARGVKPFLAEVWPLEHSLVTPGVSRSFALLPAECGDAFAHAELSIEPFLVPFDCWSMIDYGLFGDDEDGPKLSRIDSIEKAWALIRMLDKTIGTAPGAIVPHDLSDALVQVRSVAPQLAEQPSYRRLATVARRE